MRITDAVSCGVCGSRFIRIYTVISPVVVECCNCGKCARAEDVATALKRFAAEPSFVDGSAL